MEYLGTILPKSLLKNYKFDLCHSNQDQLFKSNHAIHSTIERFNKMLKETLDCNTIKLIKKQINILNKMSDVLIEPMKQAVDNMFVQIPSKITSNPFQCWYSYNPKLSVPFKSKLGLI